LYGKRTYSIAEASKLLGIHRLTLSAAIRRGEIPALRVGRRVLIPSQALERLLEGVQGVDPSQDEGARG